MCRDTDEKDVSFVALALELDAFLWTNDLPLKRGLNATDLRNSINEDKY